MNEGKETLDLNRIKIEVNPLIHSQLTVVTKFVKNKKDGEKEEREREKKELGNCQQLSKEHLQEPSHFWKFFVNHVDMRSLPVVSFQHSNSN